MTNSARHAVERAVKARIREFEVTPLLSLLQHLGYGPSSIRFRGHPATSPQGSFVHDIDFIAAGDGIAAFVVLTLNLGLVSCRGPLPSYFRKMLADTEKRRLLLPLLDEVDHSLLAARTASYRAESLVREWEAMKRDLLAVSGLRSMATLHWLFERIYPELDVRVLAGASDRRIAAAKAYLGDAELGTSAMGAYALVPSRALEVTLTVSGIYEDEQPSWLDECRRRLFEEILPRLAGTSLHLSVALLRRPHLHDAQFDDASYLSVDPLAAAPDRAAPRGRPRTSRMTLFRGVVPSGEPGSSS